MPQISGALASLLADQTNFSRLFVSLQQLLNEENLRKQEESVQKQEAMRRGNLPNSCFSPFLCMMGMIFGVPSVTRKRKTCTFAGLAANRF